MHPCQKINPSPVGAAAGCDLLILFLKPTSKDRSPRQLLQGFGNFRDFAGDREAGGFQEFLGVGVLWCGENFP